MRRAHYVGWPPHTLGASQVAAVLVRAIGCGSGVVKRPFCGLVHVGQHVLASHDPLIVEWTVLATTRLWLSGRGAAVSRRV